MVNGHVYCIDIKTEDREGDKDDIDPDATLQTLQNPFE